jgi:hypothetical protein
MPVACLRLPSWSLRFWAHSAGDCPLEEIATPVKVPVASIALSTQQFFRLMWQLSGQCSPQPLLQL